MKTPQINLFIIRCARKGWDCCSTLATSVDAIADSCFALDNELSVTEIVKLASSLSNVKRYRK